MLLAAFQVDEGALVAEELAMAVLDALTSPGAGNAFESGSCSYGTGLYVGRAQALLASSPWEQHTLDAIGKAVHCAAFHLASQFKRLTGMSMHQYQTRLRLAMALDRLSGGEEDLAWLAVDLGYAHHSHFSAQFRAVFGVTPQAFRRALRQDGLAELRRILTAPMGRWGLAS